MIVFHWACTSVSNELSDAGKNLIVVNEAPAKDHFKLIDTLICRSGVYAKTPAINIERCKRDLKNQAAQLGATHILFSIRNIMAQTNVVVMSANVYKKTP